MNQTVNRSIRATLLQNLLWVLVCASLLGNVPAAPAQQRSEGTLIIRYEVDGSSVDSMGEYSAPILSYFRQDPDKLLTVRLCSTKPLPVAIGTAAVEPQTLSDYLDHYRISRDHMLLQRSGDCSGKSPTNTATELWIDLPTSTDSIRACELTVREIKSKSDENRKISIGTHDYVSAVNRLIDELRKDPSATGMVLGYYLEKPTKAISQKLRVVNNLLRRSGLAAERYHVGPLHWTGWPEVDDLLGHLTVRIVKTNNQCDIKRATKSTIWIKS